MENHIALRVEDLMRQGRAEAEAPAQAEREFGDVARIRREMNKLSRKRRRRQRPRLSALLLAGFSLVALLLSAIGLYGVVASGVRRQTHDIGVRVALGATPGNIRRLILAQLVGSVGVGVIAGLAGALAGSRLLRSMLFQVSPIDPLTLAGVCLLLLAVASVAAYIPARRAARIDPVEALRAE